MQRGARRRLPTRSTGAEKGSQYSGTPLGPPGAHDGALRRANGRGAPRPRAAAQRCSPHSGAGGAPGATVRKFRDRLRPWSWSWSLPCGYSMTTAMTTTTASEPGLGLAAAKHSLLWRPLAGLAHWGEMPRVALEGDTPASRATLRPPWRATRARIGSRRAAKFSRRRSSGLGGAVAVGIGGRPGRRGRGGEIGAGGRGRATVSGGNRPRRRRRRR